MQKAGQEQAFGQVLVLNTGEAEDIFILTERLNCDCLSNFLFTRIDFSLRTLPLNILENSYEVSTILLI